MNGLGIGMATEILRHTSPDESPYSSQTSRLELEVAEALAVLARRDALVDQRRGEWGSKGKRAKKRVRNECGDSVNVGDYPPPRGEEDDALSFLEDEEKRLTFSRTLVNPKKQARSDVYRQNLTEEEKESRKLRRILANRESARQTIRRRQALCDELTKRAADLHWENGNLKKEKEAALEKFQSLEVVNKRLKAQMAKVYNFDIVDTNSSFLRNPRSQIERHSVSASSSSNEREKSLPLYLVQYPLFFQCQRPVFYQGGVLPLVADLNEKPLDEEDDYLLTSLALGPASASPVNEDSAAIARRKRKELTRLKNLNYRQFKS